MYPVCYSGLHLLISASYSVVQENSFQIVASVLRHCAVGLVSSNGEQKHSASK